MNWTPVGQDVHMALGHRPKFKALKEMMNEGVTHVLTLLSPREGAEEICSAVRYVGMTSMWLPMENANPENIEPDVFLRTVHAVTHMAEPAGIYVHCSAGIHRTGMFGYAVLRSIGGTPEGARETLKFLRPITAEGVTDARLNAIDEILKEDSNVGR